MHGRRRGCGRAASATRPPARPTPDRPAPLRLGHYARHYARSRKCANLLGFLGYPFRRVRTVDPEVAGSSPVALAECELMRPGAEKRRALSFQHVHRVAANPFHIIRRCEECQTVRRNAPNAPCFSAREAPWRTGGGELIPPVATTRRRTTADEVGSQVSPTALPDFSVYSANNDFKHGLSVVTFTRDGLHLPRRQRGGLRPRTHHTIKVNSHLHLPRRQRGELRPSDVAFAGHPSFQQCPFDRP